MVGPISEILQVRREWSYHSCSECSARICHCCSSTLWLVNSRDSL